MQGNITRANLCSRLAYEKGYLPIAPHAIFTQFLDDGKAKERESAMEMGLQLLGLCNELWAFGPCISEGMKREIEKARSAGIPIRYFDEGLEES